MASVNDTTSGVNLNDVIKASAKTTTTQTGVASATNSSTGGKTLGKDAFLQLLVTQMQHQNPLDPQDNSEFVAQLAQFSSLEGITSLNESVTAISGNYKSSQALQASSLVGRSVIAQTDKAVVDTTKSLSGSVVVPQSVSSVTLSITDKDGNAVRTIDMGAQAAGNAAFVWDGKNESGEVVSPGTYNFKASTTVDGKAMEMYTLLPATVSSVTISQTGGEMMLNLAGQGSVALSKVQTIGI
ncbi:MULTISPECIES: flagellar hook assembly protein FlgD [unclassified Pseudomonas]|uniref:flagellar hook assembly protein FlgD n=1 Tax=unclassified Pseudomonas TaxID=196821 RepID=UPI000BA3392D|nr:MULTISPECIES: flagellar hook assembly protein FlgD [unclassified Pseudomonas]MCU1723894.1 flagellar hook assembly protein FlgD [Pseudomonas sp. 5P_5.1_Bac1]MCU1735138.1 flagellar hook assembly protein FlgD [Pseudomonas sp. 20P_3.2_Bac4]MCU1744538.1 flagellar hook assembly protein FlgD [Pseudomonas sp. 20P_3.2_Bac5]